MSSQRGSLSGSTIGTIAGIALGAAFAIATAGAGTPISLALVMKGAMLGAAVGGTIGGLVDFMTAPDVVNRQESVAGMQIQTSAYGQPVAQVFGAWRLAGNIIWISFKKRNAHRQEQGGKGGPKRVSITYTYSVDVAIALCDTLLTGPMDGIRFAWADGTAIYASDQGPWPSNWTFYRGTGDQLPDPVIRAFFGGIEQIPGYIYTCYVVMNDYDMGSYPRLPNFTFEVYQGDGAGTPLPQVVETLAVGAGLPEAALDIADLPDLRVRLGIMSVQAVRATLESLTVAYRFFLLESGFQIVARRVGSGGVVAQVPAGDLDAAEREGSEKRGLAIARERSRLLPTQLSVAYTAPRRSYQASTQVATLGTLETVEQPRAVSTSLAMEDADAKALAQETLDRLWIERTGYDFVLGRRWAALEPGDRLAVESRGAVYTMTLSELGYGRPGLLTCKARADSAPVVFVEGAAAAEGISTDQILLYLEHTTAVFLELPAMDAQDQAPRAYVIYSSTQPESWPGATLHRSVDGGDSYQVLHIGTLEAYSGEALTVLPDAPAHLTDTTSTVQVKLSFGELVSVTPAAFQAGANLAMLGSELIAFRDAVLIDEQTYLLRHLWRGRRGTEWATGTHVAGERFAWIDQAVYRFEQGLGDRYVVRPWKAVTRGLDISQVTSFDYAPTMENLRPWSVATLRLEQSGTDWLISWRGRARFTGAWVDGSQATPDPDFLTYRVVIYSDATQATIVRQVDQGDSGDYQARQGYVYTLAQQSADFGGAQSVLYAQVYQVGRNDVSRPAAA
jgi:hypothetical protein